MAMTNGEKVALAVVGTLAGCTALYYLLAGAGPEKNAALIPDAIEDRLDAVVEALNARFGNRWINVSTDALRSVLSAPLVALVDVVVDAEQRGWQRGWDSAQKRAYAVRLASA